MSSSSKPAKQLNPKQDESSLSNEEFVIRKRLPRSLPREFNDVYVTRKTPIKVQINRCQDLLDSGEVVYIHGLGAAVTLSKITAVPSISTSELPLSISLTT